MAAVPFDTPKLADRLQAGGFTAEQAHAFASALADAAAGVDIATKADLASLATKADLAEAKSEILRWIAGAVGVQTVVTIGAVIALVRMGH